MQSRPVVLPGPVHRILVLAGTWMNEWNRAENLGLGRGVVGGCNASASHAMRLAFARTQGKGMFV